MNTIDISPTKTIVIGVINQLSYLGGTTLQVPSPVMPAVVPTAPAPPEPPKTPKAGGFFFGSGGAPVRYRVQLVN